MIENKVLVSKDWVDAAWAHLYQCRDSSCNDIVTFPWETTLGLVQTNKVSENNGWNNLGRLTKE